MGPRPWTDLLQRPTCAASKLIPKTKCESKYAIMVKPLRHIMRKIACESLWKISGANLEPKGIFVSIKICV